MAAAISVTALLQKLKRVFIKQNLSKTLSGFLSQMTFILWETQWRIRCLCMDEKKFNEEENYSLYSF